jgi:hypothetical protein
MVPSDRISQPTPRRHARHRALQPGQPGVFPSAPPSLLSKAAVRCFQAHLPATLTGAGVSKRPFALPQRLPVSEPPLRGQRSRPASSTPYRSLVLLVQLPIPLRATVGPAPRKINTENPLLDSRPALPIVPRISTTLLGPFGPFRIKAFDTIPGWEAHLPNPPDSPLLPDADSIASPGSGSALQAR